MPTAPFTVKALFEYTSEHEDDLPFSIGQIITVTAEEDEEWYYGHFTNESGSKEEGIFPRNFVERYEPPAPPRPSRPSRVKKEPEAPPPVESTSLPLQPTNNPAATEPELEAPPSSQKETGSKPNQYVPLPVADVQSPPASSQTIPPPGFETAPAPKTESNAPPPVADEPSGRSLKDRIAAFNQPTAPIAPFNPAAASSKPNAFINKRFVAPPPSNYVPIPVEQPQPQPNPRSHKAEGIPQSAERTQEFTAAGRSPQAPPDRGDDEDQPKPTSLKERIAILKQKQLETAARHAEAASKKEKKKPPLKKHQDTEPSRATEPAQGTELEGEPEATRVTSSTSAEDDFQHKQPLPIIPSMLSPALPRREPPSDANDADYSGTGDTEEAEETLPGREYRGEKLVTHDLGSSVADKEASTQPGETKHVDSDEAVQESEEEEIDPEVKKRMEIRERMAKMSGGLGMVNMLGPLPGMPNMPTIKKPKSTPSAHTDVTSPEEKGQTAQMHAPPVPVMVLPGMPMRKPDTPMSPIEAKGSDLTPPTSQAPGSKMSTETHITPAPPKEERSAPPPPPPEERAPPPLPPSTSRPMPPPIPGDRPPVPSTPLSPSELQHTLVPPPRTTMSPSLGEESDDELSAAPGAIQTDQDHSSDSCPTAGVSSRKQEAPTSSKSATSASDKGSSLPPPVPHAPPFGPSASQIRPPPPPPPLPVSRKSTSDSRVSTRTQTGLVSHDTEEEVTEYEGDYDTDIASGAKHKDALKAHGRDSSIDEGTITDDFGAQSPRSPHDLRAPPLPPTIPRGVPPPPPTMPPPPRGRPSVEIPTVPPPIPPPKDFTANDDEYDPFRHDTHPTFPHPRNLPAVTREPKDADEREFHPESPPSVAPPPPPPSALPGPRTQPSRTSVDLLRGQPNTRRSTDIPRPSTEGYHIACDVDLGKDAFWWTQPKVPPPVFQNRKDLIYEFEESSATNRGSQTIISKYLFVLFTDYSQTIITVHFDSKNPSDVVLEQRHEAPPPRLRQDQLEDAHNKFGTRISETVASKHNATVGDGTPHALVQALLSPLSDALQPVGRSYGAVVYSNLANASVQQNDEIRAGDIVTFRNARFQGHRGTMHQRYSAEVGKPDHVGIVKDWDGTKKKIRAWEQGRENKKVKLESFKLDDLRSGECRVWRVMPRSWVGWGGEHKS